MNLKEEIIAENRREGESTLRMLKTFSDGHKSWTPHEKSTPAFGLAKHVVSLHKWVKEALTKEVFNLMTDVKPSGETTFKQLEKTLEDTITENEEFLKNTDENFWNTEFEIKIGEASIFNANRSTAYRHFIMNHLIHHRGQLSVYVRLLDQKVPGMYGPTADDKE